MLFLLGIIDLLCALSLLLAAFGYPIFPLQAGAALLLLMKSVLFLGSFLSIVDIIVAIVMFILIWIAFPSLAIVLACYLTYKGAYSLV